MSAVGPGLTRPATGPYAPREEEPKMCYAGLDVHLRVVEAVLLDAAGAILHRSRFPCTRAALEHFARTHLGPTTRVALEATFHTWAIVAVLQPFVAAVVVSNPLRTKAIAQAKIKTDRVDALVLAQLLRADYLPQVWTPDAATQQLRRLTSRRGALVHDRTRIKNRLHAVLHHRLLPVPPGLALFTPRGQAWLASLDLDPAGRAAIASELRLLAALEQELAGLTGTLAQLGAPDPRLRLLLTLPGVDLAVAQTLLAALGDVTRFRDGAHAASYLGLVPSTRQSATACYHGPITKQGARQARWLLVQAAQHLGTHPGPLGHCFRRLARTKNRNVAVVAIARKLVVIAWHLLATGQPYRYAVPRTTQTKLARLRVLATGVRRRGGTPAGALRPTTYGSGQGTRAVPALDALYAARACPPCSLHPPASSGPSPAPASRRSSPACTPAAASRAGQPTRR
jgi:transposase